ncbi:solute carrier family 22 member 6 [Amia ocellicauda]|uniref:solute carrier family 22 member 6 n=1 Tax=Amia ocellicauda TaxID=2972642 RepID=UPI0034638753
MGFAEVLEQVGSTGRFQVIHVTLLSLPVLLMASHNLLQNFVAAVPGHHCAPANLSAGDPPASPARLLSAPLDAQGRLLRCRRYTRPQWLLLPGNDSAAAPELQNLSSSELESCEDGWVYERTEMSSNIITEWDLVCDLQSLKQMSQTVYMGGVLVGAIIIGALADRFGRRFLLQCSYLLMAVGGTCTAYSPSFPAFCFFRFLCGIALSGIILNTYSLIVEWIPLRVRTGVATGVGYCYTTGQVVLAGVAYCIRDWRWLTLAVSLPYYVAFVYSWWLVESSRWLLLNGKEDLAVKNLHWVARINGRKEEGKKITPETLCSAMHKELSSSRGSHSALDLLRTPGMRRITICLIFVWFSTSFGYYGLSMDLQKFGVSIYLIQVIFGCVDIPAKFITMVTMGKFGRRPSQSSTLLLAGCTVLANILVPAELQTVRTSLAVLGKGCLAAAFQCCYLFSGELYPTVIRQNGMGWVTMMARLGAMVAPMVLLLGDLLPSLPGLIYGGAPIVAGIFAFFLPETRGLQLPDTIQDVEERLSDDLPKKEGIVLKEVNQSLMKETI